MRTMLRWASSLCSVVPAYYLEAREDLAGGEGLGEDIHHMNADDVAVCQFNAGSGATITDAGDLSVSGASTLQEQSQLELHDQWIWCAILLRSYLQQWHVQLLLDYACGYRLG